MQKWKSNNEDKWYNYCNQIMNIRYRWSILQTLTSFSDTLRKYLNCHRHALVPFCRIFTIGQSSDHPITFWIFLESKKRIFFFSQEAFEFNSLFPEFIFKRRKRKERRKKENSKEKYWILNISYSRK